MMSPRVLEGYMDSSQEAAMFVAFVMARRVMVTLTFLNLASHIKHDFDMQS